MLRSAAMTKPTTTIWRTVVFSGAMLGTPLVHADKAPPPPPQASRPAPLPHLPPPESHEQVQRAMDANIAAIQDAVRTYQRASLQKHGDVPAAREALAKVRKQRIAIEGRMARARPPVRPAPPANIQKLERQLAAADRTLVHAIDQVLKANRVSLPGANQRLARADRTRTSIAKRLAAAKKRPRTVRTRPVGRGFVLA